MTRHLALNLISYFIFNFLNQRELSAVTVLGHGCLLAANGRKKICQPLSKREKNNHGCQIS